LFLIGMAVQALFVAIMPMLADTIPFDRYVKVHELLDTFPLTRAVYLGGKVLGVWVGLLIGLGLVAAAFAVFSRTWFGTFDLWLYTRLWLVLVLPGALVASGYSVVVNALSPSRRVAVLLGIALIPLAFGMYYAIAMTLYIDLVQVFRPENAFGSDTFDGIMNGFFANLTDGMLPFALALAVVWVGMWGLLRARQAK
jgi:ABC-type Na+ efflux pump permease subunit